MLAAASVCCGSAAFPCRREAAVARVWLIRHGQSESNAGLPSVGWRDIPLTGLGRRQARHLAGTFASAPQLIAASPYLRARQTAQPTIDRFPEAASAEWAVQEFSYLRPLDGLATTVYEREPEARAYWDRADPRHTEPGAESFSDLLGRVAGFLDRFAAEDTGPVAVFTHGIFMRAVAWFLLTGLADPTPADMRDFRRFANLYPVPNCGVMELRYYRGQPAPTLMGAATHHLPAALAPQDPDETRPAPVT
jgi:2,3-bisphosphoglycerate-dependent phosphoglycerate mutase